MKRIKLFLALLGFITIGQLAFAQPGSTFTDPFVVTTLPLLENGGTTCGFGNNYTTVDIACTGNFMSGEEKIYSFTPPTNMSNIEVSLKNISDNFSGLFISDDSTNAGTCIGSSYNTGSADRTIGGLSLIAGTTYYVIVSTWANPNCVSYDLTILDQTCPAPDSLYVANLNATNVDFGWTETGVATEWLVEYGASGFLPGSGTAATTTANPLNVTGLTPTTIYDFYVKVICGVGDSSYLVGPFTFTTPCSPTLVPSTESFDIAAVPGCWSQTAIQGGPWVFNGTPGYGASGAQDHTGNGGSFIWMDFSGFDESVSLVTSDYDVSSLTTPFLEFFFYTNNTSDAAINDLMVESWDGASWVLVDSIHQNLGGWTKFGYNVSANTFNTNLVRLRFRAERTLTGGNSFYQDFLLDDITVKEIPSCPDPSTLTAYAVGLSADLSWVEQGSATEWRVQYGAPGFVLGSGIDSLLTTTNPVNISGLAVTTNYEYYVRSACSAGDSSLWVGPLSFTTTDLCPAPVALNAPTVGNTATLSWTEYGSATLWEYQYGLAGFGLGNGTGDTTSVDSVNLTALNYSSTYQFYVRAICGPGDTSVWTSAATFITPCAVNIPYYSESFNSFVPNCWDEAVGGTPTTGPVTFGSGGWRASNVMGNTVALNLYFNFWNEWVLSPFFDLSAGGYEISIDVAVTNWLNATPDAMGSDDSVRVLYTEDGITWNTIVNFTVNDSLSNTLTSFAYPLTSVGSNVQFAILGTDGPINDPFDYDFHFDNFVVQVPPTCPVPSMLAMSNITGTSADFSWVENGVATSWEVQYDTAGFTTGTGNIVSTSTNPYAVSGLTPSTSYEMYVRSICGPGDTSVWNGPVSFNTAFNSPVGVTCTTGGAGYIFSDDMESNSGWTGDISTSAGDWDFPTAFPGGNSGGTGPSGPASGTTYAEFEASGAGASIATMVTPMIDLTAITSGVELSFYMHAYGQSMGSLDVGVGTSATGPFTNLFSHTGQFQTAATDPWSLVGVNLDVYAGQQIYVAFTNTNTSTSFYGDRAIDLVRVMACLSCPAPDSLNIANLTSTSVDLSWLETGTATSWEVELSTTIGGGIGSAGAARVSTTTNPHVLTSLLASTNYEYYVRSVCGAGDTSTWSGPFVFATPFNLPGNITCTTGGAGIIFSDDMESNSGWTGDISTSAGDWDFPTAFPGGNSFNTGPSGPASGTTYAEFEASGAGASAVATMVTPMIDLASVNVSAELSFYMHAYGQTMGNLEVGVGTSATGPFTPVFTHIGEYQTAATDPWAHVGIDISAYVGQQIYVSFKNSNLSTSFYGDRAIDLVEVRGCVTCPAPDSLEITNLAANSLDFGWYENGSATTWEIEYDDSVGFVLGSGTGTRVSTTNNPHSLTGLVSNSGYDFYVRSICGSGDTSSWTGPFSVTTPCDIITTFPFTEGFDPTSPSIGCWRNDYVVGNANWQLASGALGGNITTPYFGSFNLVFVSLFGANDPITNVISPTFDLTSLVAPRLHFYYGQEEWFGDQNYTRLLYRIGSSDPWVEIWSDSTSVDDWTKVTVTLPNPSATYQVAFQGINNQGRRNVIDEMTVEDTPANDLMVISVGTASDACGIGMDSIKAVIVNNGSSDQTGFSVGYTLDGTAITPEVISGTLLAFDTLVYSFSTLANFATPGTLDIEAYTILSGDFDLSNDTIMDEVSKTYLITTYPYLETFAVGQEGWEIENGPVGNWAFGTPNNTTIVGAASDTNCFVTGLVSGTNANDLSFVNSPCFDFTSLTDPHIQMSVWWQAQTSWDGATLEFSVDNGDEWDVLGEVGAGENWYNATNLISGLSQAWSGTGTSGSEGWVTATLRTPNLAGQPNVKFRVAFESSFIAGSDGFAFDDFAVFNSASLGSDTVLCTSDTLTLNPGTYTGYLWDDASITPIQYLDAAVLPEGIDTINVIVSGPGGFKMYDTVVVTVEKPVITLGNDTVVCFGEVVNLDADSGFASYIWSDGSAMQTLVTDGSTAGTFEYSVLGLTANNCPAVDTIDISVNTEVLVDLGVDTIFTDSATQGTSYTLDAGPGFASYLWSDGSTLQTYFIDGAAIDGTITVVVTNSSGCLGSDTVIVDFKLGVNSLEVSQISMYPNPTTDQITIEVSNFAALGEVNVNILDITGKVVMTETLQGNSAIFNETYDVSRLATGTYFVQFEANGEVVTRQFVIK